MKKNPLFPPDLLNLLLSPKKWQKSSKFLKSTARVAEADLGRIDAIAGDGDHGQGMTLGTTAAAKATYECVSAKAGVRTLLVHAGATWAEGAGALLTHFGERP